MTQGTATLAGAAGRYASALFDLAKEANALDSVEQELSALGDLIAANADLGRVVSSPAYSRDDQGRALAAVLGKLNASELTRKFVGLMAAKGRLHLLPGAVQGFKALLSAHRGEVEAEVSTARPLDEARKAELIRSLEASEGRKVTLKTRVDPTLLGGLVVKIGSTMIDASLRAKLSRLQLAMKEVGR